MLTNTHVTQHYDDYKHSEAFIKHTVELTAKKTIFTMALNTMPSSKQKTEIKF